MSEKSSKCLRKKAGSGRQDVYFNPGHILTLNVLYWHNMAEFCGLYQVPAVTVTWHREAKDTPLLGFLECTWSFLPSRFDNFLNLG